MTFWMHTFNQSLDFATPLYFVRRKIDLLTQMYSNTVMNSMSSAAAACCGTKKTREIDPWSARRERIALYNARSHPRVRVWNVLRSCLLRPLLVPPFHLCTIRGHSYGDKTVTSRALCEAGVQTAAEYISYPLYRWSSSDKMEFWLTVGVSNPFQTHAKTLEAHFVAIRNLLLDPVYLFVGGQ